MKVEEATLWPILPGAGRWGRGGHV